MITVQGLPVRSFSAKKVSTRRSEFRSTHNALPMIENVAALIPADVSSSLQVELVKSLGTSVFPAAIAISFFSAVQKQVSDTKELIAANKESTDKQLLSNKELIAANKEITNLAIVAAETKIQDILRDFVVGNNKKGESS